MDLITTAMSTLVRVISKYNYGFPDPREDPNRLRVLRFRVLGLRVFRVQGLGFPEPPGDPRKFWAVLKENLNRDL